jgi:hypothetical protein
MWESFCHLQKIVSFEILVFQGFRHAYSFVSDLRAQEKEQLKQELKTHTDPSRKDKIKYLLQRMVIYLLNQSSKIKIKFPI